MGLYQIYSDLKDPKKVEKEYAEGEEPEFTPASFPGGTLLSYGNPVHFKSGEGGWSKLWLLSLCVLLLHLLRIFQVGVDLVEALDRFCFHHFLDCLPVHWVLGKGYVLHRLDFALVSGTSLLDDVCEIDLQIFQLLLAEVDVEITVEVIR